MSPAAWSLGSSQVQNLQHLTVFNFYVYDLLLQNCPILLRNYPKSHLEWQTFFTVTLFTLFSSSAERLSNMS